MSKTVRRVALATGSAALLATSFTGTASAATDSGSAPLIDGKPAVLISPEDAQRVLSADGATAAADAPSYYIRNNNSFRCLVVQGFDNGKTAMQYDCANYADQRWYFFGSTWNRVQVINANSGKCLVTQGANNGAQAFQYTCGNYNDQFWKVEGNPSGSFKLVSNNSWKCLAVQGYNNGAIPFQFDCAAYKDQDWTLA
ncbi:RICIN domain-containing protein [Streptomyces sp. NPDC089919]|uniref:RICIN domain-containing protein n=1 Tax=Streptomyces sp. NPDC089919 TaxID=3155188 RepID=UPI0034167EA6